MWLYVNYSRQAFLSGRSIHSSCTFQWLAGVDGTTRKTNIYCIGQALERAAVIVVSIAADEVFSFGHMLLNALGQSKTSLLRLLSVRDLGGCESRPTYSHPTPTK